MEWLLVAAEHHAFDHRYSAVVAAEAFHWLDWHRVMPRIAESLAPGGHLVLIERAVAQPPPWAAELQRLIEEYSTNRDYVTYDVVTELESRGLIAVQGRARTGAVAHRQALDEYVESFHSRNGFSRARLAAGRAQEFDDKLRTLVGRHCPDGTVQLQIRSRVAWGRPLAGPLHLTERQGGRPMATLVQPTSKHLAVNGLRVHYLDWGEAGAPPVVCVHGYTSSAQAFNAPARRLQDRVHLIAPDVRGHGESAWSPAGEYQYRDQASDLAALVDELGLARFTLIGTSMGGIIAMAYAGDHAERLRGLVINDIGPDVEGGSQRITQMVGSRPEEFQTLEDAMAYRREVSPITAGRSEEDQRELALGVLRQRADGRWIWKMDPAYIQQRVQRGAPARPGALARAGAPALPDAGGVGHGQRRALGSPGAADGEGPAARGAGGRPGRGPRAHAGRARRPRRPGALSPRFMSVAFGCPQTAGARTGRKRIEGGQIS